MDLKEAGQRIIVALDELEYGAALELAGVLKDQPYAYKIHNHYDAAGPVIVRELRDRGAGRVWVDAKVIDIPATVGKRVSALTEAGASFITVMAESEVDAMAEAVNARAAILAEGVAKNLLDIYATVNDAAGGRGIIAVTILTSHSEEQAHLTYGQPSKAGVLYFARLAMLAGVRKVVSSPKEVGMLSKRRELKGMEFFTPGVRPAGSDAGDQQRFDTPTAAIRNGATRLVIGRPITQAAELVAAFNAIAGEVADALDVLEHGSAP